jgi:hypothetical protein
MLFAGLVAIATVIVAGSASAKWDIVEANITGPGLKEGVRIKAPDTFGLWETGIDTEGGLDDERAESVQELGLTFADLGPRYVVTYRFGIGRARQDLYPYAKGGPVTYTPPGQELGRRPNTPDFLRNMPITAGWDQSSHPAFFGYLVEQGLPVTNPVPSVASGERAADTDAGVQTTPWSTFVLVLVGLATLALIALAARRRVLAGTR